MSLTWSFTSPSAKRKAAELFSLEGLRVASPCRADWTRMSGDDRVRHCAECKLNVYNLSEMTRHDAEQLIASREGRMCVRLYRRSDGTVLTRDCPVGFRRLVRRVSRMAGSAFTAMMSLGLCAAQTNSKNPPQATASNASDAQRKTGLSVTVTDQQGAVVERAKVSLMLEGAQKTVVATTNGKGVALLSGLQPGSYQLEVNSQGFKPYRINASLTQDNLEQIKVTLAINAEVELGILIVDSPMIDKTETAVTHTFEGDLLRAGNPR